MAKVIRYIWKVRGACEIGNCDCMIMDNKIVTKDELPPRHDGCTCFVISINDERLEIEEID